MKKLALLAFGVSVCAAANAQYVIRGTFNSWGGGGDVSMSNLGSGHWSGTIRGLNPGDRHEFKVTTTDWSDNGPGDNGRFLVGASGNVVVDFWQNAPADGWNPTSGKRVGYWNDNANGWDVMGAFNGWASPVATLTHMGSGLYEGTASLTAGNYDYKFRKAGDWDIAYGDDGSNYNHNINVNVASDGMYKFSLDLPNGRYRLSAVPEPATMAVLGLGVLALLRRRKK